MEVIANLHAKFDELSKDLEAIESKVSAQDEQIKFLKDIKSKKSAEVAELLTTIKNLEYSLEEVNFEEFQSDKLTRKLELEYECLEDSLTQIPHYLMKMSEEFLFVSEKAISRVEELSTSAVKENFWVEQTATALNDIGQIKIKMNEGEAYRQQYQRSEESKLVRRLQEEELNLAYCNSCIEALQQQNRELRERVESRQQQSTRHHSDIRSPHADLFDRASVHTNSTSSQQPSGHRDTYASSMPSARSAAASAYQSPFPHSTYSDGAANSNDWAGADRSTATQRGSNVTHTIKRTVTEEIVFGAALPAASFDGSGPLSQSQPGVNGTVSGVSAATDAFAGSSGMWLANECRVEELPSQEDSNSGDDNKNASSESGAQQQSQFRPTVYDLDLSDVPNSATHASTSASSAAGTGNGRDNSYARGEGGFGTYSQSSGSGGSRPWFQEHKRKRSATGAGSTSSSAAAAGSTFATAAYLLQNID